MILVWGNDLYGRTDEVPGLFHLATRFGHLYYFPIVPMQSYLVLEKTEGGGFRGAAINLSAKSVFLGWARAVVIVAIIVLAMALVVEIMSMLLSGSLNGAITTFTGDITIAMALVAVVYVLWWSKRSQRISQASYERAMALATRANFNELGMLAIGIHFGKITLEQAKVVRDRLQALNGPEPENSGTPEPVDRESDADGMIPEPKPQEHNQPMGRQGNAVN